MKNHITKVYSTPIQLKLPVDLERIIKINDPVYSFSGVMAHIDPKKYFVEKEHETGRPRYDREKLLKIVLFSFMKVTYETMGGEYRQDSDYLLPSFEVPESPKVGIWGERRRNGLLLLLSEILFFE